MNGNDSNREQFCPEIHPEAFGFSRNITEDFKLTSLDMSKLNFSFLTDFHQLTRIIISHAINVNLLGLPLLSSLSDLSITYSSGFNEWTNNPLSKNEPHTLILDHNALDDDIVDRFLDWIIQGPVKDSLTHLHLSGNAMTRIPQKIKIFTRLFAIFLDRQQAPGFGNISPLYSTSFLGFARDLHLTSCFITDLEMNAFEGFNFNTQNHFFVLLTSLVTIITLSSFNSIDLLF